MLLEPARLSQLSGLKVVSLASPGVRPREQMATAGYFIRNHPDGKALVFVLDEWWCNTDPKLPVRFPFPFWLYEDSTPGYVKGLVSPWSAMHLWRRSQYLLGLKPRARPDGYADFTKGKVWTRERSRQLIAAEKPFQIDPRPPGGYPAVNLLRDVLAKRPAGMRVVFMFPPVYRSVLPQGASALAFGQCKADLQGLLRPGDGWLDLEVDGPLSQNPDDWWDHLHYRNPTARKIEEQLAAQMRPPGAPPAPASVPAA